MSSVAAANGETRNLIPNPADAITYTVTRRKQAGRGMLPPDLPRVIVDHDHAKSEKLRWNDGTVLCYLGEVVSEQLDVVPMRIQVIRHGRHRYGCRCCGDTVKTISSPAQPIPQSIASAGTLAHLPLQAAASNRIGISTRCSRNCRRRRPWTITRRCCRGMWLARR